mmetsp:Transcript_10146/g.14654  ORF Transcript_10146/g.14654 Transcript_10146/m.14654 type:complete len:202 (-) Transcript_10146:190-795(-)
MASNGSASEMVLVKAWQGYLGKLDSSPLLTKSISAAVLSIVSSLVGKSIAKEKIKPKSIVDEFCVGLILRGPLVHWFHTFLDKVVFRRANQKNKIVVIAKVILDQLIFAPIFISLYFYLSGIMSEKKISDISKSIKKDLWRILKGNWGVWVPANVIGYGLIPLNLRVLWGNIINIFWTAYLITKVNKKSAVKAGQDNGQVS